MAKSPPTQLVPTLLTAEQKRQAILRFEKRIAELKAFTPDGINSGEDPEIIKLEAAIESSLSAVYGPTSHEYAQLMHIRNIDDTTYTMNLGFGGGGTSVSEIRKGVKRGTMRAIATLESVVTQLQEDLEFGGSGDQKPASVPKDPQIGNGNIFIVHGRDTQAKAEAARFVERAGLSATILHEQPNSGQTIIEKFEEHGGAASFAIILLTPDDVGGLSPNDLRSRARQNVVGEMFWFAGRLGRSRVCALKKGDIELPSDFAGVGYVDMDERGAWKMELAKELTAAGFSVDWQKALS